uniref:Uncharacterized protein n=1 Tax=Heterorhabditis bacteriophora TaxID=37862 RepID=A0A1I7WV51_HETBA
MYHILKLQDLASLPSENHVQIASECQDNNLDIGAGDSSQYQGMFSRNIECDDILLMRMAKSKTMRRDLTDATSPTFVVTSRFGLHFRRDINYLWSQTWFQISDSLLPNAVKIQLEKISDSYPKWVVYLAAGFNILINLTISKCITTVES